MVRRLDLHELLCAILGSKNVYFQPPATIQLQFPCIIYSLQDVNMKYGDDFGYLRRDCYEITVVDRNPDSLIPDKIGALELASFNSYFVSDNLNHFIYTLYY